MTATPAPSFLATGRGKLTLALLTAIGFLDFADASIVNIALPDIRQDLHFSVQDLQWVLSGYLLSYGGFMLLDGRMADLLGRRKAGLVAALLSAAQQLGGALGLAVLSAIATARTNHLLDRHDLSGHAMTAGFQRALLVGGLFVLAATFFGLRTRNSRGEYGAAPIAVEPELAIVAAGAR